MRGIRTFVRALTLDAVNAAFKNALVQNVPEVATITASFLAANTSTAFTHTLGRKPEFVDWLGEANSTIYASAADKLLWTDTAIVLKCTAIANGILKVEAR